ncbi:porin [Burkholderia sp. 22PA0106]|uniref:porin n=1 Tax=Burkholderia sp. 22PA0106 TaxID=3237371 RepID=UPI0039C33277
MKQHVMALAALIAVVHFQQHAHAQSSVTLYGTLDAGIAYLHNSGGQASQWRVSTSNLSPNTWGIKGNEDLGGGMRAVFQLENGFDTGTGQALQNGRLFGRTAMVGLSSATWGTLTFGRQFDPVTDFVQPITADQFSGTFATPGDIDNYDDSAWFNNAVKWTSPSLSGLSASLMYAFGGVAGSVGSGQTWSAALGYAQGPLNLAAGYLHVDNGNPSSSARGASSADSFFNSAVNRAFETARSIDIARAAAQYAFGAVTVGTAYSHVSYAPDAASTFSGSQRFDNGSVFASWMATQSFQVVGGYNYTRSNGNATARYHQVNAGVDYLLSKRTDLYATVGYQHASGNNGAGPAQAVIGSYDVDSGAASQVLAIVGMRHKF